MLMRRITITLTLMTCIDEAQCYVIKVVVVVVKVGFCDSSSGFLVTSGSVVLDLLEGDVVSLQPTDNNAIITKDERADNTFTGFLILPKS
ncbi:unnamed protein product [Oncorhynchus mykiss]|uniref:C1q domain-containing protein n=1 Tax=Oncorhynchus mykiss TaxID=8022 RepID=A0A060YHW3_ONCMY|nr:unnamed protein product [Oncorhynchus mykiss]